MDYWYSDGDAYVCVRSGMPEQAVRIGVGRDYRGAVRSLEATPVQSTGPDGGVTAAMRWADGAGWIEVDNLDPDDGPDGDKDSVERWETVASYVVTIGVGDGTDALDVDVEVGEADNGEWFFRTVDETRGDDTAPDTAFASEALATAAAREFAETEHEGEEGEDADAYRTRALEEACAEAADDDGEWCSYWTTECDGESGPRERYATREAACARVTLSNQELRQVHRGSLLCGFVLARLDDGTWQPAADDAGDA